MRKQVKTIDTILMEQGLRSNRNNFILFTIQLRNYPLKGDTIQYVYTDSKHNNPLCRMTPIENMNSIPQHDKEKYKQMILDAA